MSAATKTSYATVAATAKTAPKTDPTQPKPTSPKTNTPRPRLVINPGPNCRYTNKLPVTILEDLNDGLAKLCHTVKLSEVHRTTKGNLVVTAAPEVSAEQLTKVTTTLATIMAVLRASRISLPGCQVVEAAFSQRLDR
jgi:hypothetical protein